MGRSDIFLRLEIIKKSYGIVAIIIAVVFFESPIAIALTSVITTIISSFVNAFPNRKLIDYSYAQQIKDVLPSFIAAMAMLVIVLLIGMLEINPLVVLCIQIVLGIVVYVAISAIFRIKPFYMLLDMLKDLKK